jgi:hypothetical protein
MLNALERPGVERVGELTVQAILHRHCDMVEWILGWGSPPRGARRSNGYSRRRSRCRPSRG